jgi:malate dehydrogenase (oxaloacetate-decarboxylating)
MEIVPTNKQRIIRTLRCKNRNVIGTLGKLISTMSGAGADIGMIKTYSMGELYNVRDISILANDDTHLEAILEVVSGLPNVTILQVIDDVLDWHIGGKIAVKPTYPVTNFEDMRKVYTPGVAQVCSMIKRDPEQAYNYTGLAKNVALITNGSRVLGLGNLGPVASMPVMEGKAALFAQFTGYNMFPIFLETRDPKKFIETVIEISSGFGAIQLEDIETPACFEIEQELIKRIQKPVMHDDQHGTAVVSLAAAINACRLTGFDLKDKVIGQIGLGAAGQSIARLMHLYTHHDVYGCDVSPEACQQFEAAGGKCGNLEHIMKTCDVVVATTGRRNLIKPEMIRKGQIILALSNPYPEINIQDALDAGAAFASDGTRVNNILGYPGILKGAMDVRATKIVPEMYIAAAVAIAASAPDRELVPSAFDPRLHINVAHAVARAAVMAGVAIVHPDEDYYFEKK